MSFTDQVVFLTGGGSGMGRLAAQRMADAGAKGIGSGVGSR